jgi:hypothetical protein
MSTDLPACYVVADFIEWPLVEQRKGRYAMTHRLTKPLLMASLAAAMLAGGSHKATAQMPPAIVAPAGETALAAFHAEGAQVYECRAGNDSKLAWMFREPIATLLLDGKTIGRHYAGPTWEHLDGSAVVGKIVAITAGNTASDIPWLRLEVTARRGSGALSGMLTVQRINTHGGARTGGCDKAGTFHSEPYATDYVFLGKGS